MWCITEIDAEFRKRMYDVLDLYAQPYDARHPVVGFDEKPKQLLEDSRPSIPMRPGHPLKYDYEYVRRGNANIFMAVDFKAGIRTARVTARRTRKDFARFVRYLVDHVYPDAVCIRLVLDNLNIHTATSIHNTFGEVESQRILRKIEFHYTPRHASWLNVAEIEIGVMDTECTRRRIDDRRVLAREVHAWEKKRNLLRKKIDWRFTKQKANAKLSVYYV
jgi:hypothetical protein